MSTVERAREWPAKALVAAVAWVAAVVGMLPAALLLAPLWSLGIFAGAAAVVVFLGVRNLRRTGPSFPSIGEVILAAVGAVSAMASAALFTIAFYWLAYGLTRLAGWLAHLLGSQWSPSASTAGRVTGLFFAVLMGVSVAWVMTESLSRQLFPNAAGVRSPYYQLMRRYPTKLVLAAIAAVAVLAALAFLVGPENRHFPLYLAVYLILLGSGLWDFANTQSRPHRASEIENAILKLLRTLGFDVVGQPRTGDPDVDPFLLKVDFFAVRGERALAIAVKVRTGERAPVEWTEASSLISAARALRDAKGQLGLATQHVDPVLIVVGKPPADSLQSFSQTESVCLIHIPNPERVVTASRIDEPAELAEVARDVLAPLADFSATTAPALPSRALS